MATARARWAAAAADASFSGLRGSSATSLDAELYELGFLVKAGRSFRGPDGPGDCCSPRALAASSSRFSSWLNRTLGLSCCAFRRDARFPVLLLLACSPSTASSLAAAPEFTTTTEGRSSGSRGDSGCCGSIIGIKKTTTDTVFCECVAMVVRW